MHPPANSLPSLCFRVQLRLSTNLSSPATESMRRSPQETGRPTGSLVRSQTGSGAQSGDAGSDQGLYLCIADEFAQNFIFYFSPS